MAAQTRLEAMNASPHHSKVKVSLKLADSVFVAGEAVAGKMEMECKADLGLGIGIMMVELFAVEELTSRDHSATSTFLHSRRIFQGPGLPPSNAVRPHLVPGDPPLPMNYYPARRGMTTFLFRFDLPKSLPSSIDFGSGLAQVRYELRASVGVSWKGENKLVLHSRNIDLVECFEEDFARSEPEGVVVGEGGRIWMQGRVLGGFMVAGQPACVELQVKNHSTKKNTGLAVSLTRELVLPNLPPSQKQPLQISDTLTSVSFRGAEYIIQPGAEGVANLVFDLPANARAVNGDRRQGGSDDSDAKLSDPLFQVRCLLVVRLSMGFASRDIQLSIPVPVIHALAVPAFPPDVSPPLISPYHIAAYSPPAILNASPASPGPYMGRPLSPYIHYAPGIPPPMSPSPMSPQSIPLPMSPLLIPYVDHGQVWLPPQPYHAFSPPPQHHLYYHSPPLAAQSLVSPWSPPPRPSSAEPVPSQPFYSPPAGLPLTTTTLPLIPLPTGDQFTVQREEGKGERASRIALHLRMSSRNRSASPPAHRYQIQSDPPFPLPPPVDTHLYSAPSPLVSLSLQDQGSASPLSSPQMHAQPHPRSPNLTLSPVLSQQSIVSPKPMLSPKRSFSNDPFEKDMQVQTLERIAARATAEHVDLSGPSVGLDLQTDGDPARYKTLPSPPVPTEKPKANETLSVRAGVASLFARETPPTPALAAVTSLKVPRATLGGGGPSGLDALEAKLLTEVGTRKAEKSERHADVRAVLPIVIPGIEGAEVAAADSAISSLALPGLEADVATIRRGMHGHESEDAERPVADQERKGSKGKKSGSSTVRKEGKSGKKNGDGGKDEEIHHLRKAAQGRINAWLGTVEPNPPSPSPTPPPTAAFVECDVGISPTSSAAPQAPAEDALASANEVPTLSTSAEDQVPAPVSAVPNPQSSGFVPIGTLRANAQRTPATGSWQVQTNTNAVVSGSTSSPHLTVYPPRPLDSEVKYDIRSARGGRGGKVTAVAAIWASATQQSSTSPTPTPTPNRRVAAPAKKVVPLREVPAKSTPTTPKPAAAPRLANNKALTVDKPALTGNLNAKRARMIKSSTDPAAISPSLAIPMLSSTASLSRPVPPMSGNRALNVKLPPTISEGTTTTTEAKPAPVKSPATKSDLAFGQARLRELIKRYQGQNS